MISVFSERMRQARGKADLTQEQLAGILGVTRSTVAQWEGSQGEKYSTIPRQAMIPKICAALNIEAEYLLDVLPDQTQKELRPKNIPTGWACPSCKRVYSPFVHECPRCR